MSRDPVDVDRIRDLERENEWLREEINDMIQRLKVAEKAFSDAGICKKCQGKIKQAFILFYSTAKGV
jgi:hypothetical protein